MKRVLVAMSGGVDSSVAAYLLKREGYDVSGATMRFDSRANLAVKDAKRVCRKLGIPHRALDFTKFLEQKVVKRFVSEYAGGKTPNPCVNCNRDLKFGVLLDKALSTGFDFFATGHYARVEKGTLKKSKDRKKDQSYFLYAIDKKKLKHVLFPLGNFTRDEVRRVARSAHLPVADKPKSQDICFIKEKNYHGFLSDRLGETVSQGAIMNLNGELLGKHKGAFFYTVGQRSGLGIGHSHPLYVLSIDIKNNRLIVGEKDSLKAAGLIAGKANFLVKKLPGTIHAKIRYNHKEARCRVLRKKNNRKFELVFGQPQEAITPGQSVVLYGGDKVLGGGVIEKAI